jgi:hypothetical protein
VNKRKCLIAQRAVFSKHDGDGRVRKQYIVCQAAFSASRLRAVGLCDTRRQKTVVVNEIFPLVAQCTRTSYVVWNWILRFKRWKVKERACTNSSPIGEKTARCAEYVVRRTEYFGGETRHEMRDKPSTSLRPVHTHAPHSKHHAQIKQRFSQPQEGVFFFSIVFLFGFVLCPCAASPYPGPCSQPPLCERGPKITRQKTRRKQRMGVISMVNVRRKRAVSKVHLYCTKEEETSQPSCFHFSRDWTAANFASCSHKCASESKVTLHTSCMLCLPFAGLFYQVKKIEKKGATASDGCLRSAR